MRNKRAWFAVPYVIWMALFVVIPILIMAVYAITTADPATNEFVLTAGNFTGMGLYLNVFLRSFWLALLATLVCLLIGYPVSYWMAKEGPRFQRVAMALIMLPMWMNFLLRTYSWMSILENNGLLNQLFRAIGLLDEVLRTGAERPEGPTFNLLRERFNARLDALDGSIDDAAAALDNVFRFVEEAFGEGQEMLMLVTDLSVNRAGMAFINDHGCERYFAHNQNLQFYERGSDLAARIDRITLEEE